MDAISIVRGGWQKLCSCHPDALNDFGRFQDLQVNLEVSWSVFGASCWWCATQSTREAMIDNGQVVFTPFELAKLDGHWNAWVEYQVFTHKVFEPGAVFDWCEGHLSIHSVYRRGVHQVGPWHVTDQFTKEFVDSVRTQNIEDKWKWWVGCLETHSATTEKLKMCMEKVDMDSVREIDSYLGPAGRCPSCGADQYITDRGYQCHAGHCFANPTIPF